MKLISYDKNNRNYSKRDLVMPSLPGENANAQMKTIAWIVCSLSSRFILKRNTASHYGATAMMYRCGPWKYTKCRFYNYDYENMGVNKETPKKTFSQPLWFVVL